MNIIFKPECKTEIIKPTYDLPIIGEPISKTGASANNSNAYGVIVGIIGDGSSRRVRVMTKGYIDYDKVKDNYMEYTDEAINALTGITLCSGGKLPTGGGGAMLVNMVYSKDGHRWTADKRISEIGELYFSGRIIMAKLGGDLYNRGVLTAVGAITDENGRWTVVFGSGSDNDVEKLKGVQDPDTDRWNYGVN